MKGGEFVSIMALVSVPLRGINCNLVLRIVSPTMGGFRPLAGDKLQLDEDEPLVDNRRFRPLTGYKLQYSC